MEEIANYMLFVLSNTKVVNSRFFKRQNVVWRRRQTTDGVVFTTRESVDLNGLIVHKKIDEEPFLPAKLFLSIMKACDHLENPHDTAWQIMQTVEEKLIKTLTKDFSTSSENLAELCIETLKAFDTTAYIKYASYQPDLVSSKKLSAALR